MTATPSLTLSCAGIRSGQSGAILMGYKDSFDDLCYRQGDVLAP